MNLILEVGVCKHMFKMLLLSALGDVLRCCNNIVRQAL